MLTSILDPWNSLPMQMKEWRPSEKTRLALTCFFSIRSSTELETKLAKTSLVN
jgi:hypothetical protein